MRQVVRSTNSGRTKVSANRNDLHAERKIKIHQYLLRAKEEKAPDWVLNKSCHFRLFFWGFRFAFRYCGLDVDGMAFGEHNPKNIKHVQFEGYDIDETGLCYGGSIPIDKVSQANFTQDVPWFHNSPPQKIRTRTLTLKRLIDCNSYSFLFRLWTHLVTLFSPSK